MAGVPRGACVASHRAAIGRAWLGGGASLCGRGARRQRRRASGVGRAPALGGRVGTEQFSRAALRGERPGDADGGFSAAVRA